MTIGLRVCRTHRSSAMAYNGAWPSLWPAVSLIAASIRTWLSRCALLACSSGRELPDLLRVLFFRFQRARADKFCRGSFHGRAGAFFASDGPLRRAIAARRRGLSGVLDPKGRIARVAKNRRGRPRRTDVRAELGYILGATSMPIEKHPDYLPTLAGRMALRRAKWPSRCGVFSPAAENEDFFCRTILFFRRQRPLGRDLGFAPYL